MTSKITPKKKREYPPKYRDWCMTAPRDFVPEFNEHMRFMQYQIEQGGITGYEHNQIIFQLYRAQTYTWVMTHVAQNKHHIEHRLGTKEEWIAYVTPDTPLKCRDGKTKRETGEFIDGPFIFGQSCTQGERNDLSEIKRKLDDGTSELQIADEHFPQWCQYRRAFQEYKKLKTPKYTIPKFSLTDYILPPLEFSKSVFLYGTSESGKTQYALAHFKHPLKVGDLDELYHEFNRDFHDGLVFDEINLSEHKPETVIRLIDTEEDQTIRIRNFYATIPQNFPRIFVHNDFSCYPPNISEQQHKAITRRLNIVEVKHSIIKQPNKIVIN